MPLDVHCSVEHVDIYDSVTPLGWPKYTCACSHRLVATLQPIKEANSLS
jgi:hypothetical protein